MPADIYSCVMYCIFYFICASGNNTDMDKSRGEGKGEGKKEGGRGRREGGGVRDITKRGEYKLPYICSQ
jgi:hypothetical protein